MAPVLVTALQGLLDQQAAEAGAVDEEVPSRARRPQLHRIDEAVGGAQLASTILPSMRVHAAGLGIFAQEAAYRPASK